jgi:rubredoxin
MSAAPFQTWQCRTCGYLYDEAAGDPAEGLKPGT